MLNRILTLLWAAAVGLGFGAPTLAQERGEVVSRYSSIWPHNCTETGNGAAEDRDWVRYRCGGEGGVAVQLVFSDGTRLSLGFGDDATPLGMFRAEREPNWPLEWRGTVVNGRFIPHAAIARMKTFPENGGLDDSELVIFGLSGPTCVLGEVSGPRANDAARRLADTGQC